jgi:hypothetical protein
MRSLDFQKGFGKTYFLDFRKRLSVKIPLEGIFTCQVDFPYPGMFKSPYK